MHAADAVGSLKGNRDGGAREPRPHLVDICLYLLSKLNQTDRVEEIAASHLFNLFLKVSTRTVKRIIKPVSGE
jgi:hypothetical protein